MFGTRKETGKQRVPIALLLGAGLVFTGCLAMPVETEFESGTRVALGMRVTATDAAPGGGAGSGETLVLDRLVVTMASAAGDTLRDTLTSAGSRLSTTPARLNPDAGAGQLLHPVYPIAPGRDWNFTVETFDSRDSLVHTGTVEAAGFEAGELRNVYVRVHPRFARYEARFPLPATAGARKIFFRRLVIEVDGIPVRDSASLRLEHGFYAASPSELAGAEGMRFFPPKSSATDTTAIVMAHEYLRTGQRAFAFKAFGYLEGDTAGTTPERLLYQGETGIDVVLGKTAAQETVALEWTGAESAEGPEAEASGAGMQVTVGKVHTAVINVIIPGAVDI